MMLLSYCDFDVGDLVLWKQTTRPALVLGGRITEKAPIYGIVVEADRRPFSVKISIQFVGWSGTRDFGKYDYSELDNMEIVQKA
jgi:hypothetical protein